MGTYRRPFNRPNRRVTSKLEGAVNVPSLSLKGRKESTFYQFLSLACSFRALWPGSPLPVREACTDCLWPAGGSGRRSPFRSLSPGHGWQAPTPGAAGCWPVPRAKAPGGRSALGGRSGLGDPPGPAPVDSRRS